MQHAPPSRERGGISRACYPRPASLAGAHEVLSAEGSGRVAGTQTVTYCADGKTASWGAWAPPVDTSSANPHCSKNCTQNTERRTLDCPGGEVGSISQHRIVDSCTGAGAWITDSNTCACPAGLSWNGADCVCTPGSQNHDVLCADGSGRVAGTQTVTYCADGVTPAWGAWTPASVDTSSANPACRQLCAGNQPAPNKVPTDCSANASGAQGTITQSCPFVCKEVPDARFGTVWKWVIDSPSCTFSGSCGCPCAGQGGPVWVGPQPPASGGSCQCPAGGCTTTWDPAMGSCPNICTDTTITWVSDATNPCIQDGIQCHITVSTRPNPNPPASCQPSSCTPQNASQNVLCANRNGHIAGTQTRTYCADGKTASWSAWAPPVDTSKSNPACTSGGSCPPGQVWADLATPPQCCTVPNPDTQTQAYGSRSPGQTVLTPGSQTRAFNQHTCAWNDWVKTNPTCESQCGPGQWNDNGHCCPDGTFWNSRTQSCGCGDALPYGTPPSCYPVPGAYIVYWNNNSVPAWSPWCLHANPVANNSCSCPAGSTAAADPEPPVPCPAGWQCKQYWCQ